MKYKLLIIDDEKIVGMLIKRLVIKSNLHDSPLFFTSGKDGLEYLGSAKTDQNPHLILLDINMPHFNGWDFLDALTSQPMTFPVFVVIITSSINTVDKLKAATYSQVIGYFEKPISREAMHKIRIIDSVAQFYDSSDTSKYW